MPGHMPHTRPLTSLINEISSLADHDEALEKRRWAKLAHPALGVEPGKDVASLWGAATAEQDRFAPYFSSRPLNFSGERLLATMPHRVGLVSRRGFKHYDQPNQDDFFLLVRGELLLFGICDGHGRNGHLISHFVQEELPRWLMERVTADGFSGAKDWATCAREAFTATQRLLEQEFGEEAANSGSTATVILVFPGLLLTAHVGDSQAVLLGPDGFFHDLTEPHRPDRADELARITAAGGKVEMPEPDSDNPARLRAGDFGLAVSRGFGDLNARSYGFTHDPQVPEPIMLADNREYSILVCSDGVWDMIPAAQAVSFTSRLVREAAQETVEKLALKAQHRWQDHGEHVDDITSLLVRPCFKESARELRSSLEVESGDRDKLLEAFRLFDSDGDGTISKDEVLRLFQALDPRFTKEDAEKVLLAADTNLDGRIDYAEFVSWLFH